MALAVVIGVAMGAYGTPQQPPAFRSAIDVVRLDVSVLDKDRRPVRDLVASDFAITVDGAVQPIVAFEAVVMPPREEPTAPWMRDVAPDVKTNALGEPRLFVIIMDDVQTPLDPYMANSAKKHRPRHRRPSRALGSRRRSCSRRTTRGRRTSRATGALLMTAIDSFRPGWMPELRSSRPEWRRKPCETPSRSCAAVRTAATPSC